MRLQQKLDIHSQSRLNRGALIARVHQRSPAQAHSTTSIAISHYSASPQRLATSETQSEQCLSQQAQPPRRDEPSERSDPKARMFGPRRGYDAIGEAPISNADKPRVQPVKVDPKVFFANERTFLAWVHMALMLGGMAVGIIGFSTKSGLSPLPGLVLLPVAICFVVHALGQYYARARAIRRREPGPYEDKNGPVALAIVLSLAACSNILIHLVVSSR